MLLPESLRDRHVEHRERYTGDPVSRPMAEGQDLYARHRDGRDIAVDIGLAPMYTTDGPVVAAFVRDATVRRRALDARQRLHDAEVARRHALEVNDNVLQGLTTAIWQLDVEDTEGATRTLDRTLAASRQMVADLLDTGSPGVVPGGVPTASRPPRSYGHATPICGSSCCPVTRPTRCGRWRSRRAPTTTSRRVPTSARWRTPYGSVSPADRAPFFVGSTTTPTQLRWITRRRPACAGRTPLLAGVGW